jgi:HK97 family phage major capsid protein
MTNLLSLKEARTAKADAIRAIISQASAAGRDLTEQEQSAFDAGKSEVEKLEKEIRNAEFLADLERRMDGQKIMVGSGDSRLDVELRSFSLRKAILSQVPGHTEDCARERELSSEIARRSGRQFQGVCVPYSVFHQPIEQRVMISDVSTGGGAAASLVATDLLGGQYIDRLREALIIRQLGATVLPNLVGNVDVPRLETSATVGWVAENSALTPSDQEYDSVSLRPKHAGGIVEFSRNLLLQSSPAIEGLIRNDFAQVLARAVDTAALVGGGANQPVGITETAAVDSSVSFSPPSWESVLQLIEVVEAGNAVGTAFATNAGVIRTLRSTPRIASTDSQMVMEAPRTLAGYPVSMSSLVPSAHIIFGNWADLLLGFWSELDLLTNPFETTAFSKGNILVRGMLTCDVQLRHAESFAFSSNVDTTA